MPSRRLLSALTLTAMLTVQFQSGGLFELLYSIPKAEAQVYNGRWVQTWAGTCSSVCSAAGMVSAPSPTYGAYCTSGEAQNEEAYTQLGAGIYLAGCWNVPCGSSPRTVPLTPVGGYCYRDGQKRDYDATDITAACYCRDLTPAPECNDGLDNDGNGFTDYPNDQGCASASDNDESGFHPSTGECSDGRDNDGDGQIDVLEEGPHQGGQTTVTPSGTVTSTVNNSGDDIVLIWPKPYAIRFDDDSATRVCQISGYGRLVSKTKHHAGHKQRCYWSPEDNSLLHWSTSSNKWYEIQALSDYGSVNAHCIETVVCADRLPDCSDGADNDNDGQTDYPRDSGCASANDFSEIEHDSDCSSPSDEEHTPECRDGIDNDNDGATDHPNDFSCSNPDDDDESDPESACQDGRDNDGDGQTDYPRDPGCSSAQDDSERDPNGDQCDNGQDDDNDGDTDYPDDPGCSGPDDDTEENPACNDGVDNDGDGQTDYPRDPGCSSADDNDERGTDECDNGQDDDGDGQTDFPRDPGCTGPSDNDERGTDVCDNGNDDDGDGQTDFPRDPGCSSPTDNSERDSNGTECDNDRDDDNDGDTDYPDDSNCTGPTDDTEGIYADLELVSLTGPNSGDKDDTLLYYAEVENHGPDTANTVVISLALPTGVAFDSGASSSACIQNGNNVLCNNFDLNNGQSRQFTIGLIVESDIYCGRSVNLQATVSSSSTDPNSGNNSDNKSTSISCPVVAECEDGIDNDGDGQTDFPRDPGCSSATDTSERDPNGPQCDNGQDDDNDGDTDYPADSNCTDITDDSEAAFICNDGVDNDGDGQTDFPRDPGCSSETDNSERDPNGPQCDNGQDDDNDGDSDYPADSGCTGPTDDTEDDSPAPTCNGLTATVYVNGGGIIVGGPYDGYTYQGTLRGSDQNDVIVGTDARDYIYGRDGDDTICGLGGNDNIDGDNDDDTIFGGEGNDDIDGEYGDDTMFGGAGSDEIEGGRGNDTACGGDGDDELEGDRGNDEMSGGTGNDEIDGGNDNDICIGESVSNCEDTTTPVAICGDAPPPAACSDGADNDGDGQTDFPRDPGCSSANDTSELGTNECDDGVDNDNDGDIDFPDDSDCSSPSDTSETTPECSDGLDNDGDGNTDYPADPGCSSAQDDSEAKTSDLSVTKTDVSSHPVQPGDTVSYTLRARNHGPDTATNVVVSDPIPSGLTFNPGASDNDCIKQGSSILCNNLTLNNGASRVYTVSFDVPGSYTCGGAIDNSASVSTSATDPISNNNQDQVTTPVVCFECSDGVDNDNDNATDYPADFSCSSATDNTEGSPLAECQDGQDNDNDGNTDYPADPGCTSAQDDSEGKNADLSVDKSGPGSVNRGTTVAYTLVAENHGPDVATNIVVSDPIPSGLTFNSGASDNDCIQQGSSILCNNLTLLNGASRSYTVVFNVPSTYTCGGTIVNDAAVSTSATDNNSSNNTDSASTTVDCFECSDGVDNDNDNATDYPDDFSCSSATDNTEGSPLAECQDGQDNDGDGNTDYPADPGCASSQDDHEAKTADLYISKSGPLSIDRGGLIQYVLLARNYGPEAATNVVVTDLIPADLTFNQGASDVNCIQQGNSILCNNFSLSNGASRQFNVAFDVSNSYTCGGTIVNDAAVSASSTDPNSSNNQASLSTVVNCFECNDGADNDNDGATDYPADFSCSSATDNTEGSPLAQCQDGQDNDNDGFIDYPNDPSCTSAQDNTEDIWDPGNTECSDNVDNDNDGATDYPADFACTSLQDDDESDVLADCQDGIDNDSDNFTDFPNDPGCSSAQDDNEFNVFSSDLDIVKSGVATIARGGSLLYTLTTTNHGPDAAHNIVVADNIPAGLTFNPGLSDPECVLHGNRILCDNLLILANGSSKTYFVVFDVPNSYTCNGVISNTASVATSSTDPDSNNNTTNPVLTTVTCTQCNDGVDNDNDGATDYPADFACTSLQDNNESDALAQCQDNQDNDGDNLIDFPADPGCLSNQDNDETHALQSDLEISKSGPLTIYRGNSVSYTLTVTNNGPDFANNIVAEDPIPSGLAFNAGASDPDCVLQGSDVLCNNTQLVNGASRSYTVTFDVPPSYTCGGSIQNSASVSTSSTDPIPANNQTQANTTVQCYECDDGVDNDNDGATDYPADFACTSLTDDDESDVLAQCQDGQDNDGDQLVDFPADPGCLSNQDNDEFNQMFADLEIIKSGVTQIPRGSNLLYTLTVNNHGPDTAYNVVAGDWIPAGLTFNPTLSDNDCVLDNLKVLCDNLNLPSGASRSYQVVFDVSATLACNSVIQNTATVSTSSTDPDSQNNISAPTQTTITCAECDDGVDNDNDGATDYPADFACTSLTDNDESDVLAQCQDGQDNDNDGQTDFPNDPDCSSAQDNNETGPVVGADLSITKTGPVTAVNGSTITYTLNVTNSGPDTATNIVASDTIPAGLLFNSAGSDPACTQQGNDILCNNLTLANGASRSFAVAFDLATTVCAQVIQNSASVSTSATDPVPANNQSQVVSTTVQCPVSNSDLSIGMTGPLSIPRTDTTVSYTVTATNNGPDADSNVVITYPLPVITASDGTFSYDDTIFNRVGKLLIAKAYAAPVSQTLVFIPGSSNPACTLQGPNVVCNVGSLPSGTSIPLVLTFQLPGYTNIPPNAIITITNNPNTGGTSVDPNANNNQTSLITNVFNPQPTSDLSIIKSGPATVNAGSQVSYTLLVTNNGPDTANNVVAEDSIPAGLTFNSGASDSACVQQGTDILCNNLTLANGASRNYTVVFDVPGNYTCGGTINNSASVSTSSTDPVPANNQSGPVTTTVQCPLPQADLSIIKSGPTTVNAGSSVSYTLLVTNNGPDTANNVVAEDSIPAGLTFNSGASDNDCIQQGSDILCNNLTLANGASRSYTVVFDVPGNYTCGGTINNSASVSTSSTDPVPANNQSGPVTTTVNCPVAQADLTVTKSGPANVNQGSTVSYVLTAINLGPDSATNVVVSDPIPAGLVFNAGLSDPACVQQGTDILCDNLSLANGASRAYTVVFDVPQTVACNSVIPNGASVSTSTTDPNSANNQSSIVNTTVLCPVNQSDLSITKIGPATAQKGGTITYTLTATNHGPDTANNVVVADTTPVGLIFNAGLSDPACVLQGPDVLCNNVSLVSGQSVSYIVVFDVQQTAICNQNIDNQASVSTSSTDLNPVNNTSQLISTIVQCPVLGADLSIVKTGPATAPQNGTVTYSLTATNHGPDTAQNVVVSDPIPAGLTFNAGASDQDCVQQGTDILCNSVSLINGASRTFLVTFDIPGTVACSTVIPNAASVSTSTTDPNPVNNQSQIINTTVDCGQAGQADLSLDKTGPSAISKGDTVTYTLRARNIGPDTANNVTVTDYVPAGLIFSPANSSAECVLQLSGTEIVCTAANPLAVSQEVVFSVSFEVPGSAVACSSWINNIAVADATETDPNGTNNISTAQTQVGCPGFSITKTANQTTVIPGSLLRYDIRVTNESVLYDAIEFTVTDVLPANVAFINASHGGVYNSLTHTITWIISQLDKGLTQDLYVDVTVNVNATGTVDNTATVANQIAISSVPVSSTSEADVEISKHGPVTVQQGGVLEYNLWFYNNGGGTADDVVISDPIPTGLTFNAGASDSRCVQQGNDILCNFGSVVAGAGENIIVAFDVPQAVTCNSTLTNRATISTSTTDPNNTNNVSQDASTVVQCGVPTISVQKTDNLTTARPGDIVTYEITITNTSNILIPELWISDLLPQEVDFISASHGGQLLLPSNTEVNWWHAIPLNPLDTVTLTMYVQVKNTVPNGVTMTNFVFVGTSHPGVTTAFDQTTIMANSTADVGLQKTGPATVQRGSTLIYTLTANNTVGPDTAQDVTITDAIPTGLTFNSAQSTQGCVQQGTDILCSLNPLALGVSSTVTIAFDVPGATTCDSVIANNATVSTSTTDPNMSNNISQTVQTTVQCGGTSTFTITKTDNQTEVEPGETLTYSIVVTNTSTVDATNVTVTDSLPGNVTYISASDNASHAGGIVTWSNLSISANSSKTLTVTGRVGDSVANGTILTNSAFVNGIQATDTTTVQDGSTQQNLTLTLSDSQDPVEPCEAFTYTVRVTNLTANAASNKTVTLVLDNDVDYLNSSNGGSHNNSVVTWNNLSIAGNSTLSLTANVRADCSADDNDILRSTAYVDSLNVSEDTRVDDGGSNNDDLDLTITEDTPDPVEIGEILTYNIRVCNDSNSDIETDVIAYMDNDTSFVSASDGGDDDNDDEVKWDNIDINDDDCEVLVLRVRVRTSAQEGGTLRLEARAGDSEDTEHTRIVGGIYPPPFPPPVPNPGEPAVLTVDKTADRREVQPNSLATYSITIRNTSPYSADGIIVDDSFTAGSFTVEDAAAGQVSGNGIRWTIPSLAPNAMRVIRYRVRISPSMRHGQSISNTVTVTSPDVAGSVSDTEVVNVLEFLPQTGIGGFFNSLSAENQDYVIRPRARSAQSSIPIALPMIIWYNIIAIGLGGGALAGRRLFL